jgi:7-cyano-7-deazaguanine synthase
MKTRIYEMKTAIICSGGLDSVTLAYKIKADETRTLTRIISFDYGQRHKKELDCAKLCAEKLNVPFHLIDISAIGAHLSGSSLTDDIDVPDGHYAEESMRVTVVPNRNAIMLSIAYGIASANDDEAIATAVHGGDHFIYPDCRPGFIRSFEAMQYHALEGLSSIALYTPFLEKSKTDIATEATELSVPIAETWSCYKGGENQCGRCGTCVERIEAFHLAGKDDPTLYDDDKFWIETCAHDQKDKKKKT